MINKVYLNPSYLKFNQPTQPVAVEKPTFKSSPIKQEKLQELNGLDTQAIYMSVSVQKAPSTMNDLEMPMLAKISDETDMSKIEGKPVYDSKGELVSVIVENNFSKAVYKADSKYPDKVGSIDLYEKASGKKISNQKNYYGDEDGVLYETQVHVVEQGPIGQYSEEVDYDENGDIIYQYKGMDYADGSYKYITKYRDGEYSVLQGTKDGKTSYRNEYGKDKSLKNVEYSKSTDSASRSKTINFYNGVAYSIEERKLSLEPKLTADKLVDKSQFVPTEPSGIKSVDKQHLLAEVLVNDDIEKTYYSDGSLESIIVDGETLNFSETGEIVGAKYDGKTVEFNENSEVITETLEDGTKKVTKYFVDGTYSVFLKDVDKEKYLAYRPNGTVSYYTETKSSENNERQYEDLYFNDAEVLESSHSHIC